MLRNSGIVGGKFLERRTIQKPVTKENYEMSDFFVGAVIEVFSRKFVLHDADEYAFNYMVETKIILKLSGCRKLMWMNFHCLMSRQYKTKYMKVFVIKEETWVQSSKLLIKMATDQYRLLSLEKCLLTWGLTSLSR
jgi:hypothetical protein